MKFTEGYWLRSERVTPFYASDAYFVDRIPNGVRILCPTKKINTRGDVLNLPTITLEFTSAGKNMIAVRSWHYEAYESGEARFPLNIEPCEVEVSINDDEIVMVNGKLSVKVDRKNFSYSFIAEGEILTTCGFRNLAYYQYDREISTMLPADNYFTENCKKYMVTELSLDPGECVYGLGERFTPFVKNGQSINTWNEDGGTSSDIAYKSIPFYMTNKGYGVFADHTGNVSFEVASDKVEYVGMSVPGEEIRYVFIYGPTLKEVIGSYTDLTGKPALPPAWSFGLWLSTSFTTDYDEGTTGSFIQGMADRDIPLSVFHFDCYWMKEFHWCDFEWDERVFPDVKAMLSRYHEKGLKICAWINPYIAQGTEFFREGVKGGYLLKRADGKGVKQVDTWQAGMGIVDFTNPEAKKWYLRKLKEVLDAGVDCFKTDFGERIPVDVVYHDGSDPVSMHNYYTYLYNEAVFGLLREVKGESEAMVFARSATAGCQKFPVHWGGDCSANYPSMAETLRGGLSFAMSGFSFWSHDISGFEYTAAPDLYKRWVAFGLLSSHSRLHGSTSYRVPWAFDEESCDVVRFFTKFKCSLMPYIYSKAVEAHETGIPVMRPMVFEYTEDPACRYLDMQYMLGDSILAAPVFNDKGTVDCYLPKGKWTHLLTEEKRDGGRFYKDRYDYFSLGLYAAPDSVIARGREDKRPDYDYEKNTVLHVYELSDGNSADCLIVNKRGEHANRITVSRNGDDLSVKSDSEMDGYTLCVHIEGYDIKEYALKGTEIKVAIR
ncbi:MAG: alpha-xylosidase [Lachnospiraceae bacterium]|nr:alpha-xylosidase [Lachnospiraceae bacterium]